MRRHLVLGLSLGLLFLSLPAFAEPPSGDCGIGPGLAATLLFPYFEVDVDNPAGITTLLSINNGLSGPALARVVMWTDWGVPTVAFDIYLEGFDVQTLNVRDIFNGVIPSTGEGADLSIFPFCTSGIFTPIHDNPVLSTMEQDQIFAYHTSQPGPLDGNCASQFYPDFRVRGYITVDVVDECSGVEAVDITFAPNNTGFPYFADGGGSSGIAITDNRLWGDIFYIDSANNAAQGSEAVAIWADPNQFTGNNIFTFYGRYSGFDGRDDRVPLPWLWDQRFLNGGPFAGGADLTVWRDTASPDSASVSCAVNPSWWPLQEAGVVALDEEANGAQLGTNSSFFPNATQRVSVASIDSPFAFGWIQVNTAGSQTWVQPVLSASGRFSAGANGIPIDFLCNETPNP